MNFASIRRGKVSAVTAAITLMVTIMALFAGLFGYFLAAGIRQTQTNLEERSAAAAQVVGTNAFWIAEVANQTLSRIDASLGPSMASTISELAPVLEGVSSVTHINIIDAEANTIYSSTPGANAISVTDREYFTAVRDGAPFYTSPLLESRLTGERIFVFSKRMERNREFAGAVMVSFPETLLREMWENLELDDGSTVSLIRDDGQLIARFPPADGPADLSQLPLFIHFLPESDNGTYTSDRSPLDGIARTVSYRKVPGTSIIALAAISSAKAWSGFNNGVVTVFVIVSPILLGLILGCFWIVQLLRREARRKTELEASVQMNTMLFREIHHRVKNNMQSVSSLVRMQNIPEASKRDLQSRFAAMAAMHEHIYQHDRYQDIDAHDFIPSVVNEVIAAYGSGARVEYDLDHVAVDRDHATPLALLLSELVTNSLKYAFGPEFEGVIRIELRGLGNGRAAIIVRDNGKGIEGDPSPSSMGMRLVKGVVSQMRGTHQYRNEGGAIFEAELVFRSEPKAD